MSRLKLIKGKSLALIGESGSGKTTFGKLAVGLEKVSSGTISFMGKEIQNLKEKKSADCAGYADDIPKQQRSI